MAEKDEKPRSDKRDFALKSLIAAVIVVLIIGVAASVYFLRYVVLLFFLAVIVALFLTMFIKILHKKFGFPRWLGLSVTCFMILVVLALFIFILAPPFLKEGADLVSQLPNYLSGLNDRLANLAEKRSFIKPLYELSQDFNTIIKKAFDKADDIIIGGFSILFQGINGFVNIIAIIIMAIYLALNPRKQIIGFAKLFGPKNIQKVVDIIDILLYKVKSWMLGQFTSMTIIAVIYIVGFSILGIPHAIFLGLLGGLISFIPYIGPIMGIVVPAVLALSDSPIKLFWIVIIYVGTQILESYIVLPMVMKERVNLPPVLTIIAIVAMGELFGVFGMLVALPLTTVVIGLIDELYLKPFKIKNYKLEETEKEDSKEDEPSSTDK
ncbi:MAG: AI-2E family transporter [Candidatus Zixiibacteriota bacterium]